MRTFFALPIVTIALSVSVPAMAQDIPPEAEAIERMNDPAFQDGLANMMSGFLSAMMEIPIGQVVIAADKAIPEEMRKGDSLSTIDSDTTIGDLAGSDDPDFNSNMDRNIRKGTAMLGIMASEFGAILPQLREIGERMKRRMDDLE